MTDEPQVVDDVDDDWDPFGDLEDREHLERVADVRRVAPAFPAELLTTDPARARAAIRMSKAEKAAEKAAAKPPIPAPEIPMREAQATDPIPKAASKMQAKAEGLGWSTRLAYGRGPWLGARDRTAQVDVVLLGMRRGTELIRACWRAGKFEVASIYSPWNREPGPNWKKITSPNINKALEAE